MTWTEFSMIKNAKTQMKFVNSGLLCCRSLLFCPHELKKKTNYNLESILGRWKALAALTHLLLDMCLFPHRIWYSRRLDCSWTSRPVCGWACDAAGSRNANGSRKKAGAAYICVAQTGDTALFWTPWDIWKVRRQQERMWLMSVQHYLFFLNQNLVFLNMQIVCLHKARISTSLADFLSH